MEFTNPKLGKPSKNVEGYLTITISYGAGWFRKLPYHKYIWEQEYGPVPEGYIIHHKDEDKLNNSLDNLELLTKAEHMRLHKSTGITWEYYACPVCGIEFRKRASTMRIARKRGYPGPYCGKSCAGFARGKDWCDQRGIK